MNIYSKITGDEHFCEHNWANIRQLAKNAEKELYKRERKIITEKKMKVKGKDNFVEGRVTDLKYCDVVSEQLKRSLVPILLCFFLPFGKYC